MISVVICTRNRAAMLERALVALNRQTLDPQLFEILVIDNGSADETSAVARRFENVRYLLEHRVGLSHARNLGWNQAMGEYVAYTDDDCEPPRQWLEVALRVIEGLRPDVFGGPYRACYHSPKPAWFQDEYGSRDRGPHARCLGPDEDLAGNNIFFRRDGLAEIGGFDASLGMAGDRIAYGEETEAQERVRQRRSDATIYYEPELWLHHLVRPEQMTLRWRFRSLFGKGASAYRAGRPVVVASRPRLLAHLVRTVVAGLIDGTVGSIRRDRRRYPRAQNYLHQHTGRYLRTLGSLWAAVREGTR